MIYSREGVVFLTVVKVRDIVSRVAGLVFTEQKGFAAHPRSLPRLSLSLAFSVWSARLPAA